MSDDHNTIYNTKTIGRNVKSARTKAGLTQSELAEKAGISLTTLRTVESGNGNPKWTTLESIAYAMGFPNILELIEGCL